MVGSLVAKFCFVLWSIPPGTVPTPAAVVPPVYYATGVIEIDDGED